VSSKELLTEILVRSSLGGWMGSSIRSILPEAPGSATFELRLTASGCLPRPPLKSTRRGRPGSGPAKTASDYRAAVAGSACLPHELSEWGPTNGVSEAPASG